MVSVTPAARDVTGLLQRSSRGDEEAMNELMPLVYEELNGIAGKLLKRERRGHTLLHACNSQLAAHGLCPRITDGQRD